MQEMLILCGKTNRMINMSKAMPEHSLRRFQAIKNIISSKHVICDCSCGLHTCKYQSPITSWIICHPISSTRDSKRTTFCAFSEC